MKIIDIQLGRKTSYGGTAARQAQPWQATVFSPSRSGGAYPDEVAIPEAIAQKMAEAAYHALVESGFFEPAFAPLVIEEPGMPQAVADNASENIPVLPAFLEDEDQVAF